ncbi:MAG: hypothetical protein EOP16_00520 [Pseudonocardia sp.]|nr:MAG: hypothetical protein EOP16_00520 [Pseudonocardia sp.]
MSDFSRSPWELLRANQENGYVGIHIEQGVPILDRDLNLLHDLIAAGMRSLFSRYVGNGVPAGVEDGFAVRALPAEQNFNDFEITGPGRCLVGGLEVAIEGPVRYSKQPNIRGATPPAALTTPTPDDSDPRIDTVYLDVLLVEVDSSVDTSLANSGDVGMQTSVRLKPAWTVRVAEGVPVPDSAEGHVNYPLATIRRRRGQAAITSGTLTINGVTQPEMSDLRQCRLSVSDLENRITLLEKILIAPRFALEESFRPRWGFVFDQITLKGDNFDKGEVKVFFGDVEAPKPLQLSAEQIVVKVPGGVTPGGTHRSVSITVKNEVGSVVSDRPFAVKANPVFAEVPNRQFAPTSGSVGTEVTLFGFNFNGGAPGVKFGVAPATVIGTPDNTRMVVQVPEGLRPNDPVPITVTTAMGECTSSDTFRVDPAPPTFADQPFGSARVGDNLKLRGNNFNVPPVTVAFVVTGSAPVAGVLVGEPTTTEITVRVPQLNFGEAVQRQARITVSTRTGSVVSTGVISVNRS